MDNKYYVYFRNPRKVVQNILGNPDFSCKMDYHPYHEFISATDERQWCNFMSGDWAWNQAVRLSFFLSDRYSFEIGSNRTGSCNAWISVCASYPWQ